MPRVLIAVFDGLQPSQICNESTPVINELAKNGVRFQHNHAVFPTVTRSNAASLVTGLTPGKHGLTANKSVFPEYSCTEVVDALVPKLPEINKLTGGRLLLAPTVGELISQQDLKWISVVGGTSGNAYIQHPNADKFGDVVIHPEFTNPSHHHETIISRFGNWPAKESPAAELLIRTADVTIKYALDELDPDVLLVWFPEPDTSQHAFGIDSAQAKDMYSLADQQLGRIITSIDSRDGPPDVIVVSDHGYSTIDSVVDIESEFAKAGFHTDTGTDRIVVAENGGSLLMYIPSGDRALAGRLVEWLISRDWVGAVAAESTNPNSGKYATIADIGLNGQRSPHVVAVLKSWDTLLPAPLARTGIATGGLIGAGSHGGGSESELHNTLIASGPSFRSRFESRKPSGNIDLTPTILHLLGLPVPDHLEGRVLSEALIDPPSQSEKDTVVRHRTKIVNAVKKVRTGEVEYLCEFG